MKAKVDGKVVRNLRLVADGSGAVVWQWDADRGVAVPLWRSASAPERVGATTSWAVDGLVLDEQRGCGCSHPMYAWVPPSSAELDAGAPS